MKEKKRTLLEKAKWLETHVTGKYSEPYFKTIAEIKNHYEGVINFCLDEYKVKISRYNKKKEKIVFVTNNFKTVLWVYKIDKEFYVSNVCCSVAKSHT